MDVNQLVAFILVVLIGIGAIATLCWLGYLGYMRLYDRIAAHRDNRQE